MQALDGLRWRPEYFQTFEIIRQRRPAAHHIHRNARKGRQQPRYEQGKAADHQAIQRKAYGHQQKAEGLLECYGSRGLIEKQAEQEPQYAKVEGRNDEHGQQAAGNKCITAAMIN